MACIARASLSANTWLYVSSVVFVVLCPSLSAITRAATSELINRLVTLYNTVRRFRAELDRQAEYERFADDESAALLQAYVPAQLALLQLMKEESEENDHE